MFVLLAHNQNDGIWPITFPCTIELGQCFDRLPLELTDR